MKKLVLFAAVAALVLASCAKTETYYAKASYDDAVTFGAYSGRTITKGGPAVDMNLDSLKKHGFGVFATYTQLDTLENLAENEGVNDNFMFNQQVTYDGSAWTYSPVKYWPNPTNGQNADKQLVSFFAYAPYTDSTNVDTSYGITGFSTAAAYDNPADTLNSKKHVHNFVHYKFSKDKPNVDLMWGYRTKNVADTTYTINNNLTRTTDKVSFIFQHLLSKLGGSQEGSDINGNIITPDDPSYVANGLVVKANPVSLDPTKGFGTNDGTKITISKIVIGSAPTIDSLTHQPVTDIDGNDISYATNDVTGKLDLYTGVFKLDGAAQNIEFSQTITNMVDDTTTAYNEAKPDSELADFLKEPATVTDFASIPKGVVKEAVNVYKSESSPVILIPGTKPVIDITITYTVRTYDAKLPKGYSEVPQTVWGRIKFDTIKKNTKYNIVMIIGLNDVKFEAKVEDWATGVVGQVWHDDNGDNIQDPNEMYDVTDTEIGLPSNL